ncbi:hypothetical protein V7112_03015 [Bacillus sp. JJ1566]
MTTNCFYCQDAFEKERFHYVAFVNVDGEREETLCKECYQEWLAEMRD